jgi:NIPSNAP
MSAFALAGNSEGQVQSSKPREYYELRKYYLQSGPQMQLTENYLGQALIPALNRLGLSPVGAFKLDIGPETPAYYVLIPSASLEALVTTDLQLAHDEHFLKLAEPFWSASAKEPAFVRTESSLLIAFEGWPKLKLPQYEAPHSKRIFQLRTYESPSNQDHVRKVEMFHSGEFEIFQRAGFRQVFYGDTLVGPRLPNLTYMLSFSDLAEMTAQWAKFSSDPDWKKLSSSQRYSFEQIVSNITNLVLSPLSVSQI